MVDEAEAAPVATPKAAFRARNLKLALFWAVLALLGLLYFAKAYKSALGLANAAIGLVALAAAIEAARGVRVDAMTITLPRTPVKPFPAFNLGRSTIGLSEIRDITSLGRFAGFEMVSIAAVDGQMPLLFANRAKRIAFFDFLKATKPEIRIYRAA
jgi:hypothetical protein